VAAYFKNEQEFIKTTIDNTVKRIIKTTLNDALDLKYQVTHFKPKVYESWYCDETHTLAIHFKCTSEINVNKY
jgi:hypothetical protein